MNTGQTYLVTGAMGCIGSWVLHHLVQRGDKAVSFDLGDDRHRLDLLLTRDEQKAIQFTQGDLRDTTLVKDLFMQYGITRVIHLAALQVPFCKADPVLGAEVNVVGTVNVFEAARVANVSHIAYASSVAVFGPPHLYDAPILNDSHLPDPHTLYGVYKVANEGTAKIYWSDHGISSTTVRPYTVYGVGRDQGLTSEPTKAMLAAAKGEAYEIGFSGTMQFQLASDIARYFIACADTPYEGAGAFNIGTPPATVADVLRMIKKAKPDAAVSGVENELPFPAGMDGSSLQAYLPDFKETPLEEGVRQTIEHFARTL